MVKWVWFVVACCVVFLSAQIAVAHHGAAGLFDTSQTVELTGSVKIWSFVNPHPVLVVEVIDEDGQESEWDIYFGPPGASILRNRGYGPDTFKFGDVLTIQGHPARAAGVRGIDVFGDVGRVMKSDGTRIP